MILQALVSYYEDLVKKGEIAPPGWGKNKVTFALDLDDQGQIIQVISQKTQQTKGKKTVLAPKEIQVPMPVKRTVGVAANFLCDHSGYLLGVDNKGKPERTAKCFAACKALHEEILSEMDTPEARALLRFFDTWDPTQAPNHPALQEYWEELISGCNLIFYYNEKYIQEDAAIRGAWERYYLTNENDNGPEMVCLVTGKKGAVEATHPAIKGIQGAQSSGAALVSFNAPAFCSYGKEQNYNAPLSQYAAFAYTTALNHLIADREHTYYVGDTFVLLWAQGAEKQYTGLMGMSLLGGNNRNGEQEISEADLQEKMKLLCQGRAIEFDGAMLRPDQTFYVLGLAPNAARVSVRFFLKNSFGAMMKNVAAHYERINVARPKYDPYDRIPLWKLLGETVNQKSKDKTPAHGMAGDVLRSILMNEPYPATLLNGVMLRIRAEHEVTRGRAAIIKAYYLKRPNKDVPEKEVLTVALNKESTSIPYQLGRLFAVLEQIQETANPGLNTTIHDKYFNSAAATPGTIFPVLINLAQKHLRKIKDGQNVYLKKKIGEVTDQLGETFPNRMNLAEQGAFQLGYYHETQARYQGKNKEEE